MFIKKIFYFLIFLLSLFYNCVLAQEKFLIKGLILDKHTKAPISGAVIQFNEKDQIIAKNTGYYHYNSASEIKSIKVYNLGYDTLNLRINIKQDSVLDLYLNPFITTMDAVLVTAAGKKEILNDNRANFQTLNKKELSLTTGFLGQKDVFKAIRSLPGVANGGEGNSGLFVRGGTGGQNLTLFNDAIIYNPMHMLGLFSVFNPSITEDVTLYKSGVPSEHPGRLSALVDVKSDKSITNSPKFEADVSPFSINTGTTLPITDYWNIGVWGRKTFMNQTVWPVINELSKSLFLNKMKYDFYDVNIFSNLRLGTKDVIYFSAYSGGDDFGFGIGHFNINNYINWVNTATSLNWVKTINNKITLNTTGTYSGYNFKFGISQEQYNASIKSHIRDLSYKSYLNINLNRHQLKAGVYLADHKYIPNTPSVQSADTEMDYGTKNIYYADEGAIYIIDDFKWNSKIGLNVGMRLNYFRHKGPYSIVEKSGGTLNFGRNETITDYLFLDPSISLNYQLNEKSALKLSFNRNTQPLHLISVTAVNFPADFWMPSVGNLQPAKGYQGSIGYYKDINNKKYSTSLSIFYKKMYGLAEFSGGIMNLIDNMKIEDNLYYGNGDSWGTELFIKKTKGRFGGWLSYTFAVANRQFDKINEGKRFPFKYDRRHDISLTCNYKINRLWSASALFTFASGNAYTKPVSRYMVGGNLVNEYGSFNGSRMPAYHRMDISAGRKLKSYKRLETELSISVYNIYNRQNPMYMFYIAEGDLAKYTVSVQAKSIALLPVLPAINYKIYLK
ncbi:TonB-dependent receptor plug domain-containing protein [Pseudopedobacter beijingensis]|uniref:TonB-dependent receptor plug domain-containing protein n=1 Tax=Pseudopedobacter beijingensis TaxID=1207056 RepID=A0ABW4IB56_9SPHI